jgi:hypothetical protein
MTVKGMEGILIRSSALARVPATAVKVNTESKVDVVPEVMEMIERTTLGVAKVMVPAATVYSSVAPAAGLRTPIGTSIKPGHVMANYLLSA